MRNILILGAGKSSIALVDYLTEHAPEQQWQLTVADITEEQALQKTKKRPHTGALGLDISDEVERRKLMSASDIVISMLPHALHIIVAKDCLLLKKHLVTPSYISPEMKQLGAEIESSGLIFMNEMGLDPGIDHMSAMQLIEGLKAKDCSITGFQSHCGGLVAPESDNNPWHYKFTWNPRNVVLAGQGEGGIRYRENKEVVELTYEQLFSSASQIAVDDFGVFESYPNRDSLKYISEYGLDEVETMYRGTLRIPPFCKGWNCLVKLGLTQEKRVPFTSLLIGQVEMREFLGIGADSEEYALLQFLEIAEKLQTLKTESIVPAQFLQSILEEKWKMQPGDKDLVVMVHEITYLENKVQKKMQSALVCLGKDEEHTAMATTVGLPVAMVTKLILNGQIKRRGVMMPKYAEIYNPILAELKNYGIIFNEKTIN